MEEKILQELREAGIDVDGACERFMGNTLLYQKFLFKFLDDHSFENLSDALCAGNLDKAFEAAHALKGVCGNLSFTMLFTFVSEITELLRAGNMEKAIAFMPELTKEYDRIVNLIGRIRSSN